MESIEPSVEAAVTDEKQCAEDEAAFNALWAIAAPGVTFEQVIGVIAATRRGCLPGNTAGQILAEFADHVLAGTSL